MKNLYQVIDAETGKIYMEPAGNLALNNCEACIPYHRTQFDYMDYDADGNTLRTFFVKEME